MTAPLLRGSILRGMSSRRVMLALFLPAGVLSGHALQSLLLRPHELDRHAEAMTPPGGQVPVAAATVLVLVAIGWSYLWGRDAPRLPWQSLAAAQLSVFAVVEVLESTALATPILGALHDPRWWTAALCQIAVGAILSWLQAATRRAGEVLAPDIPHLLPSVAPLSSGQVVLVVVGTGLDIGTLSRRGPPVGRGATATA